MTHVIIFAYVAAIMLAVAAVTVHWLSSKGDKEDALKVSRPFITGLLVMNIYDFVIFYYVHIMTGGRVNTLLSIGDCLIALLVVFWIEMSVKADKSGRLGKIAKFAKKYFVAYIVIWIVARILWPNHYLLRVVIDIPYMIMLVACVSQSVIGASSDSKMKEDVSQSEASESKNETSVSRSETGAASETCEASNSDEKSSVNRAGGKFDFRMYRFTVTVCLFLIYGIYLLSEMGVKLAIFSVMDFTVFLWLLISCANVFYIYKRDFKKIYAERPPEEISAEDAIRNVAVKKSLTARESEILKEIYDGKSNTEIAQKLFISESTVKAHVYNLFRKLETKSRLDAVRIIREERKQGNKE